MEILTHSVCEIDIIPVLRLLYMIIYSVEEYEIITAVSNFNKEKNIFYVFFFFKFNSCNSYADFQNMLKYTRAWRAFHHNFSFF